MTNETPAQAIERLNALYKQNEFETVGEHVFYATCEVIADAAMPLINHLAAIVEKQREALEFYGDPSTYFAIAVLPDRPCGDFIEDCSTISKEEEEQLGFDAYRGYDDHYFGKCARKALTECDLNKPMEK